MPRKQDIRLGQLLIQHQWCSLRQINEALAEQRGQTREGGYRPLGRILVERGVLEETRLRVALAEQGMLVLRCEECEQEYRIEEYQVGEEPECPDCGRPLSLVDAPTDAEGLVSYHSTTSIPVSAETFDPSFIPTLQEEELPVGAREGTPVRTGGPPQPTGGRERPARRHDRYVGKVFGGCRIVDKIAAGGMGVVYKALQLSLARVVAVKILSRELSNDEKFVERFKKEAVAAAQFSHPNIVQVIEFGDYQGVYFFTMEFVDGRTLKQTLKESARLAVPRALEVTLQVAQALRHAHQRGIIHRDIKPENIMITHEGAVKLADLGLAKNLHPAGMGDLTQENSVLGTPFYMPPEQAKDFSRVDARSDIYSLGVTLFKMLSGKVPFSGRTPFEILIRVIDGKRPRLSEVWPDTPEDIERIVDRMMDREPDRRYQDIDELMVDLRVAMEARESDDPVRADSVETI